MEAKAVIVDKNDVVVGAKPKSQWLNTDIQRVTALWLTNSKGEILLAQRALTKRYSPGKWGPAASGTVEEGETYDSNIIKEVEEEIGIKDIKPTKGPKFFVTAEHSYFRQMYYAVLDAPITAFKFPKEEVSALKWFSPEEIRVAQKENPENFTHAIADWMNGLF